MEKASLSFFIMSFILLFVVISFIIIVFDLHRFAFVFELGLLLIFIFFLAFAMFAVYYNKKWGYTIIGANLILILLNTFFIYLFTKTFETAHLTVTIFSIIGLLVAIFTFREPAQKSDESGIEEQYEKAKDYYPYIDKMEPKQTEEEQRIEKTFTPGKFIASIKANKFHIAKCDWAKRVKKSNQVWFNSREEAEAQGFEADECV